MTEELKNPYVNLPRAIMIGIPLVTFCYLGTLIRLIGHALSTTLHKYQPNSHRITVDTLQFTFSFSLALNVAYLTALSPETIIASEAVAAVCESCLCKSRA